MYARRELQRGDRHAFDALVLIAGGLGIGEHEPGHPDRRDVPCGTIVADAVVDAEPQPPEAEVREDVQRVTRLAGGVVVGSQQLVDDRSAVLRTRATHHVQHGALDRVLLRARRVAQQRDEVGGRELLAVALKPDHERVELALLALCAGELDHVHTSFELGNAVPSVLIAPVDGLLGVDVDDLTAAPLSRETVELRRDRLAATQAANEGDGGGAVSLRGLGRVVLDGAATAAGSATDVDAARGADAGGADRHRRGELLGRHLLQVVAQATAAGARQRVVEQLLLQHARAMQMDVAVRGLQAYGALLELLAVAGAERQGHAGVEHRGVSPALQDRLVLAGAGAVLVGAPAGAVPAAFGGLRERVVDVHDPLAHLREGLGIAVPAHVHDGVDGEVDGLER